MCMPWIWKYLINYAASSTYVFQLKESVDFYRAVVSENGSDSFLLLFWEQTDYFVVMNSVVCNHFLISLTPILEGGNKILLETFLCWSET